MFNVALKHWLSGGRGNHHSSRDHSYLYGINEDLDDDYGQSSAYQTCLCHLLLHHSVRALNLIVRIVNFSVWTFGRYRPDNLEEAILNIDGVEYNQKGNYEYWAMYRGTVVTSDLIMSVLMALERWLLDWASLDGEIADSNLDFMYNFLLTKSESVATTSVLASVAMAYPARIGARVLPILGIKPFYSWDSTRMTHDLSSSTLRDFKNSLVQPERNESNQLPHRKMRLEDLTNLLQREGYKEEVHAILDKLWHIEPMTTDWRLALKRMDLRHWEPTEVIEHEGKQFVVVAPKLEHDLQTVVDEVQKDSALNTLSISAFLWAKGVMDNEPKHENTFNKWTSFYETHKADKSQTNDPFELILNRFSSAQEGLAAIGVRDYWDKLSVEQRRWCITKLLENARISLQSRQMTSMLQGETLAVLPLLLNKAELKREELLTTREILFHSLIYQHDNNVVVPKLLNGVVENLWWVDYDFAMSCITGLCRLAYCSYVLHSDEYGSQNRLRQQAYRKLLIDRVINCQLKFRPDRVNRIADWSFHYLARALEMINWSLVPADCIQLAQRCVNLYIDHLSKDYNRDNRWHLRERVNISELMRMEDQVGRSLYFLPTSITHTLFYILLEQSIDKKRQHESVESVNRVMTKIILLEDRCKQGYMWPLWTRLSEFIKSNRAFFHLKLLYLRLPFPDDGWDIGDIDWTPILGKQVLYQSWFEQFGENDLFSVVRLMSDVGLNELTPSCLLWLSRVLPTQSYSDRLKSALERLVQRAYYRHKQVLRNSQQYRDSFLVILNWLIEQNSPVAYELRDRFV